MLIVSALAWASVVADLGQPNGGAGGAQQGRQQCRHTDGDEPAEEGCTEVEAAVFVMLGFAIDAGFDHAIGFVDREPPSAVR